MKYILIIMLFTGGCVSGSLSDTSCPSDNIIIGVVTPFGEMPALVLEGSLNADQHGTSWITQDEWDEEVQKQSEDNI